MKKGQFSVEYLLIVGFALIIIIPIVYYAYTSFTESQQEISAATVNKIGYEVVNTAKNVYFLGQDSRVTLDMSFPEGIQDIHAVADINPEPDQYFFMIKVYDSEILFPSDVELKTSTCGTVSGITTCTFDPNAVNQGIKKVKLQSKGGYVEVSIQ